MLFIKRSVSNAIVLFLLWPFWPLQPSHAYGGGSWLGQEVSLAIIHGRIDSYSVSLLSPMSSVGKRIISLSGSFGKAVLRFFPSEETLPENRRRNDENAFDVYYHLDSWVAVIDVLRHEKPVRFFYDDASGAAQIHSGGEPVRDRV